jgi:hypothetical protein
MPAHHRKQTAGPQNLKNGARQKRPIRNAMKGIGQKHVIHRTTNNPGDVVGIGLDKPDVGRLPAF